jgi:hypothetical protein
VAGGRQAQPQWTPPSFALMREGFRIYFETPEDGEEPDANRAFAAPMWFKTNRCALHLASFEDGFKNATGNFADCANYGRLKPNSGARSDCQ